MLKFTGFIGSSLAAFLVVPTTVFEGERDESTVQSLEVALSETVSALDVLTGIQARAESGEPLSTAIVREVSEPPALATREQDEKLQLLRTQISLLQQELDLLEARSMELRARSSFQSVAPETATKPAVTTGLQPGTLESLRKLEKPAPPVVDDTPPPVEHEGYSADALLQGQACYRAGKYERGIELLSTLETPAGLYWLGRCLERVDRLAEAVETYGRVLAREDAGTFADRAKSNLEFVQWKLAFVDKLPESARK